MKKLLPIAVLLLMNMTGLIAQGVTEGREEQAYFPGGAKAWVKHVKAHKLRPDQITIEDVVWLSFIVKQDGRIDSVKVTRGSTEKINQNAMSIIEKSPRWVPAKKGSKPVDSRVSIKIPYHISRKKRKNQ